MASEVSIINGALRLLGAARISSFAEDSENAIMANEFYADVRDRMLRLHPWNFALERAQLAKLSAAPLWEFANQYNIPSDSLRILEIENQELWVSLQTNTVHAGLGWFIEGGKILTDLGPPINIKYIKQITDTNQFDSTFISALEARLALEFAEKTTGTSAKVADLDTLYRRFFNDARAANGQEGTARPFVAFDWLTARH